MGLTAIPLTSNQLLEPYHEPVRLSNRQAVFARHRESGVLLSLHAKYYGTVGARLSDAGLKLDYRTRFDRAKEQCPSLLRHNNAGLPHGVARRDNPRGERSSEGCPPANS